jgi:cbb3-type cytochrome oxidase maturation protein
MSALLYLIPAALFLGLLGLLAFLWSIRSGQFDDMDGAANRILFDDDNGDNDSEHAGSGGKSPEGRKSSKTYHQ